MRNEILIIIDGGRLKLHYSNFCGRQNQPYLTFFMVCLMPEDAACHLIFFIHYEYRSSIKVPMPKVV